MATERLIIEISETGTRVVQRNLQDIGASADKAAGGVAMLKGALAAVGIALSLREAIQLSDAYSNLTNRLRVATSGTENLRAVMGELGKISSETRTSLESNAELYHEIAHASDDLGISQRQVLDVVRSLDLALKISGGSAEGAAGGVRALARAFALGSVTSYELRAIMNQLPEVADVLADHFNVTRAALRNMVEKGAVSAHDAIAALVEGQERLAARAAKVAPTVAGAFTHIRNQLVLAVGAFNEATGASGGLARAITFLGDHVGVLAGVLTGLAVLTIPAVISAVKGLTLALAANPFGLLAIAIGTVVAAFIEFKVTVQDVALAFESPLKAAATFSGAISGLFHGLVDATIALAKGLPTAVYDLVIQGLNAVIRGINWFVEQALSGINDLLAQLHKVEYAMGFTDADRPMGLTIAKMEEYKNPLRGAADDLGESAGRAFFEGFDAQVLGMQAKVDDLFKDIRKDQLRNIVGRSRGPAALEPGGPPRESQLGQNQSILDIQKELDLERELLGKVGPERKALADLLKLENELKKQHLDLTTEEAKGTLAVVAANLQETEVLKAKQGILEDLFSKDQQRILHARFLGEMLRDQVITQRQYNQAMREAGQGTDTLSGAAEGFLANFKNLDTSISTLSYGIGQGLVGALDQASAAFADFALSGFRNVEDLRKALSNIFADISKMILQMIIKMLIMKAIEATIGAFSASGPAEGGVSAINLGALAAAGRASGGPVEAGRMYVVGERGPEPFVPRTSGTIVPAGQAAGPPPVVNVMPAVVLDPEDVSGAMNTGHGEKVILQAIQRNRTAIKGMLS